MEFKQTNQPVLQIVVNDSGYLSVVRIEGNSFDSKFFDLTVNNSRFLQQTISGLGKPTLQAIVDACNAKLDNTSPPTQKKDLPVLEKARLRDILAWVVKLGDFTSLPWSKKEIEEVAAFFQA